MAMILKTLIEGNELLTKEQMYTVDAAAIKNGISGSTLMENAGRAVVVEITKRFKCQHRHHHCVNNKRNCCRKSNSI